MDGPTLTTFPTLDEAESALEWIGVEFVETESAFEGELVADDLELLDLTLGDPDTPGPVRELAAVLRALLVAAPDGAAWRVAFSA